VLGVADVLPVNRRAASRINSAPGMTSINAMAASQRSYCGRFSGSGSFAISPSPTARGHQGTPAFRRSPNPIRHRHAIADALATACLNHDDKRLDKELAR
jgi:hypothetical protein